MARVTGWGRSRMVMPGNKEGAPTGTLSDSIVGRQGCPVPGDPAHSFLLHASQLWVVFSRKMALGATVCGALYSLVLVNVSPGHRRGSQPV